jgi:hypothetical protein
MEHLDVSHGEASSLSNSPDILKPHGAGVREWTMHLRDRFLAMACSHGAAQDAGERWWRDVERRYSEGHRHYHTLTHIGHMLELLPDARRNPTPSATAQEFPART